MAWHGRARKGQMRRRSRSRWVGQLAGCWSDAEAGSVRKCGEPCRELPDEWKVTGMYFGCSLAPAVRRTSKVRPADAAHSWPSQPHEAGISWQSQRKQKLASLPCCRSECFEGLSVLPSGSGQQHDPRCASSVASSDRTRNLRNSLVPLRVRGLDHRSGARR
jgi:hypothetical protein